MRLGTVSKHQAETARMHIEDLIHAKSTGASPNPTTTQWLTGIHSTVQKRLAACGLVDKGVVDYALGPWIDEFIRGKKSEWKPGTLVAVEQVRDCVIRFFGFDKSLRAFTQQDASRYRAHLVGRKLSEATIRRRCKRVRQFFRAAVEAGVLIINPFTGIPTADIAMTERKFFVPKQMIEAVIEQCPNMEWKLMIALARFGGLRTPSELDGLRWSDFDFDRNRFTVQSPKTEHLDTGGTREVPIFAELKPYIEQAYEQRNPHRDRLFSWPKGRAINRRTQFIRIIKRAGFTPWPRLFQNLRASRETELVQRFPPHVVAKWFGHSPAVAVKHYLQVRDADFDAAASEPPHTT